MASQLYESIADKVEAAILPKADQKKKKKNST